jgi:PST family polysaccharide transporter
MNIREKAVKGAVWSAIQNWGSQAGSLIVFFVLARLLAPQAFGLVALANIFIAFMQVFLDQGFTQALIQRRELEPEHLDTAFWTNLAIGSLLAVFSFIAADFVAGLFEQPQLAPIVRCFSLLFFINSFSGVQQALLERKFAFRAIAVRTVLATFISGVVGIVMAYSGFGVWSLVSQQLVFGLVATLVLWGASDWRPGFKFSTRHFRHLFSFGISILGFNFLSFFNTRADDFLIGYFLGPVALGYYSVAYRVLTIMTQVLVNTSSQVTLPTFSRLQEDLERFRSAFYAATRLTSAIAFPIFLGVAALAPELVAIVFGKQWMPSAPILQILAFAGIFRSVTFFKGSVFMAMGKPAWRLWLALLNAVLNLIGFTLAVQWGIVAVALSYVIRGYMVFPISQWAVSKLIKTPMLTYLRQFVAPLVCSLVMTVTILTAKQLLGDFLNSYALLVICTLLGAAVYGLAIRFFAPKLFQQLMEFVHFASSRFKRQKA